VGGLYPAACPEDRNLRRTARNVAWSVPGMYNPALRKRGRVVEGSSLENCRRL